MKRNSSKFARRKRKTKKRERKWLQNCNNQKPALKTAVRTQRIRMLSKASFL